MSKEIKDSKAAAELYFSLLPELDKKPVTSYGRWKVCFSCMAVTHHSIAENQNHRLSRATHYICDTCGIGGFYT